MTHTPNPENQVLDLKARILPCPLFGHLPDKGEFTSGPYISVSGAPNMPKFYAIVCPGCCSTAYDEDKERVIRKWNARVRAAGDEWRQGMKDAAKEICDACDNEERYGPARKIKGSTRWWHGDDNFPCEAGGIWHALQGHTTTTPPAATAGDAPLLTEEESQLVIGAIPLQALPEPSSRARAAASRVVNINAHGEPTRTRLREIEASVSNGYETECRELGWSRALQAALRDLYFLLTFFRGDTAERHCDKGDR